MKSLSGLLTLENSLYYFSNETVCVVWRDACLLAHITPKPTDGQEAPIKDPLTFSGSYFTPPGLFLTPESILRVGERVS